MKDHYFAHHLSAQVVPETDDPSIPTLTIRVWLLGTALCILGAAISQLFFFKSNAPSFSSFFIILIALPLGKLFARFLPDSLNHPTPFSKKEHVLVGVLASSGASAAYAGEIVAVQELYYHSDIGTFGGLLLLLSTQLIGFGLSGLTYNLLVSDRFCRREQFLLTASSKKQVRPTSMLWPSQLVTVSLYQTLHGKDEEDVKETKQRMRFFSRSFTSIFAWQFIPSVIFPTLTSIATLCLINNRSWVLRTLGSGYDGFGILDFVSFSSSYQFLRELTTKWESLVPRLVSHRRYRSTLHSLLRPMQLLRRSRFQPLDRHPSPLLLELLERSIIRLSRRRPSLQRHIRKTRRQRDPQHRSIAQRGEVRSSRTIETCPVFCSFVWNKFRYPHVGDLERAPMA